MMEKRFELILSGGEVSQYEIIDHEQKTLTIYNDLGNVYFSSANKICDLLNILHEENERLKLQVNDYSGLNDECIRKLKKVEMKLKKLQEENLK